MNELVFVTPKGNVATDSLKVAEVFGKAHKDVLKTIRTHITKLEETGEQEFGKRNFAPTSFLDVQGKERPKYVLTEDAFTLIAMGYNTVEAMKFKVMFINEFNRMKEYIKQQQAPALTPMEQIAQALELADGIIKEQKLLLEIQAPKVVFAKAIEDTDEVILVRDLAKIITQNGVRVGEKGLYEWFRENKYICKKSNKPTQKAMELELFRVVHHNPKPGFKMNPTTKVTPKGQEYFINKFIKKKDK